MPRDIQALRIEPDGVVEALVEIRFSASDLADIIPAKLSTFQLAKGFVTERLPLADMPRPMRQMDANLAVQPILQQRATDGSRIAKLGEQVFSWHALGRYPGWSSFEPEIRQAIEFAFATIAGLKASRIGIRYINVFNPEKHGISNSNDLALKIEIADKRISGEFNLNYMREAPSMMALIKLATPSFVEGLPIAHALVMDIDVGTATDFVCDDANQIMSWLDRAHMFLKTEFFAVIPDGILVNLEAS